jgi:hypothetical protein
MNWKLLLKILALVCFGLAALGISVFGLALGWLGLLFWFLPDLWQ